MDERGRAGSGGEAAGHFLTENSGEMNHFPLYQPRMNADKRKFLLNFSQSKRIKRSLYLRQYAFICGSINLQPEQQT